MVLNFSRHPQLATVEGYKYDPPPLHFTPLHPHSFHSTPTPTPHSTPSSHYATTYSSSPLPSHPPFIFYIHNTPTLLWSLFSSSSQPPLPFHLIQYQRSRPEPLPQPRSHGTRNCYRQQRVTSLSYAVPKNIISVRSVVKQSFICGIAVVWWRSSWWSVVSLMYVKCDQQWYIRGLSLVYYWEGLVNGW